MNTQALKGLKVPVEVVLGGNMLSVEELSLLGEGSIVELDAIAGEAVQFRAAGELVARGEVVVIDENFGIRITRLETGEAEDGKS